MSEKVDKGSHPLRNQVVVITGASSGIGADIAIQLAERGAIPILMARTADKLSQVAERISGLQEVILLDVTSSEQVHSAMAKVIEKYGKIDVLINNAGYGIFDSFAALSIDAFADMMNVNYMGIVRCTKAVLPYMLEEGKGHIINIASLAGKIGTAKSSAYSATKHAVLGFTNSLRLELKGSGITLTAVNPGPVKTPFFDRADPSGNYLKSVGGWMLNSERVAKAVIDLIGSTQREIDLPWIAGVGIKLFQLFPGFYYHIASRWLNRK